MTALAPLPTFQVDSYIFNAGVSVTLCTSSVGCGRGVLNNAFRHRTNTQRNIQKLFPFQSFVHSPASSFFSFRGWPGSLIHQHSNLHAFAPLRNPETRRLQTCKAASTRTCFLINHGWTPRAPTVHTHLPLPAVEAANRGIMPLPTVSRSGPLLHRSPHSPLSRGSKGAGFQQAR